MDNEEDGVGEKQFDLELGPSGTNTHPREAKPRPKTTGGGWHYFSLASELGFDIALPMVLGLIVGTRVDQHFGTQPKATLGLLVVGLVISCASLIRIVRQVMRRG